MAADITENLTELCGFPWLFGSQHKILNYFGEQLFIGISVSLDNTDSDYEIELNTLFIGHLLCVEVFHYFGIGWCASTPHRMFKSRRIFPEKA